MTNVIYFLASGSEGSETLPLTKTISPLLPAPYDIVWSLVAFLVIIVLFTKAVLPKFQEVLKEREDRIIGGIQRAEAAQADAKAALEKHNTQLAEARAEAAQIREDARARGKQIEAEARAAGEEEKARIIESGTKQLLASREQITAELSREMGERSIALASKILGSELSEDVKCAGTIDRFLAELDDVSVAGK